MGERLELSPLVIIEAHHQRVSGGLEPLDIHLAHVHRGCLRAIPLVFHFAQLGRHSGPIPLLLGREIEPALDAGDLNSFNTAFDRRADRMMAAELMDPTNDGCTTELASPAASAEGAATATAFKG